MTEFFDCYNFDLNFQFFPLFKYILFLFKNVFLVKNSECFIIVKIYIFS
jgi:hypothetical protein